MKFSLSLLKQFLETDASAQELADKMVSMGLEVEGIEDESRVFDRVVVGHIETRVQHPDADKLGVCTVHVGETEPRTIVCGAPNARDNITVAVALDGACLPGDFIIKPTKMRGVTSNGMICSERELGLGDEHDGIWEVETTAEVGTPIAEVLGKSDLIFDVSITPNRGDALSVYGIARDLAAGGMGTLKNTPRERSSIEVTDATDVQITYDQCSFFTLTKIQGVNNAGTLPMDMTSQLHKAGLRTINPIADLTNYMLLAYGQPMHAYDANKVQGQIRAAAAKGGETLEALDGHTYTLAEGDIAIMDDSGVIGLGGIVGGVSTSVDENTTNVYLELAHFDKDAIARTGQRLQANTDARYRFERGIDPSATVSAAADTVSKIIEICGGTASKTQITGQELPKVRTIDFDPTRIKTFGGLDLSAEDVRTSLESLGFDVKEGGKGFLVQVPHYFTIMETPEDLIEELLRLKGLDAVPAVLPKLPDVKIKGADAGRSVDRQARRFLASNGYLECINYSFVSEYDALLNAHTDELLVIDNPLDEEHMSTMRTSLIPSLLRAAAKNMDRSIGYVRLAEVGKVYTTETERKMAAAVIMGAPSKSWQGSAAQEDVFAVKADAEAFLAEFGLPADRLQVRTGASDMFHPGRSGTLALGKNAFARFGDVHPSLMKKLGLKGTALMLEVDLEALDSMNIKPSKFEMSSFQPSTRDFALLVDESVAAGDLLAAFKGADRNLVKEVNLFDVYQGEKLEDGKKSVALSVTLQASDRTLTEGEITKVTDKAVQAVKKRYNAEIR